MHEIEGGIEMIVFHASNIIVMHPDIRFSRDALDFGKGFYVTELREQAVNYADKFRFKSQPAILNIYELSERWKQGNILRFERYNEAWLDFVIANRRQQTVNTYDAVEGGVANDGMSARIIFCPNGVRRWQSACSRTGCRHLNRFVKTTMHT